MNWYKVTLKLRGATGTPWQADTIFGHLCWCVRHHQGESALRDFLAQFLDGEPPFLLSDGFPEGLLPRPRLFKLPSEDTVDSFRAAREARKQEFLTYNDFLRAVKGELFQPEEIVVPHQHVTEKNQINRLTGTTGGESRLFSFIEYWSPEVSIYLALRTGYDVEFVKQLFAWVAAAGYGKRKSVGYGTIASHAFEASSGFPVAPQANAFVSLSSFVPAEGDPVQGSWGTRIKYGKLGEEYAIGEAPFKRPILMLTAGSAFLDSPVRAFYGRMVGDVSPAHPEVVQYGYALPVPCVRQPKEAKS